MVNRIYFSIFFLIMAFGLFSLTGCASTQTADDGSSPAGGFSDVAYPFNDVPIPTGFKANRERSFVYESGSGSIKVGRLYFSGWNAPQEVVNYYQNAMINKGWKMINAMEHDGMILNYEKKGWVCTLIVTEPWIKTHLEIQIGPK